MFAIINKLDSHTKFKYIAIFIVSLFLLQKQKIGLNIILALFMASVVVYYMYDKSVKQASDLERQHELKESMIQPDLENVHKYKDIVDFLFSIQDMYSYNPQTYEELVDNLISFFVLYEELEKGVSNPEQLYEIGLNKKNNALNCIHALIYSAPVSDIVIKKIVKAQEVLDELLNEYLHKMKDICNKSLFTTGYTNDRGILSDNVRAFNRYVDNRFEVN